jgi:hypothetical protein
MLANVATNMVVRRTVRGLVPALLRTNVAILFAILYFDNAAAIVKPPKSNIITGVHIAEKMYEVAALESNRCLVVSDFGTRSNTTRKGTRREVTKSGIA